MTISIWIQEDRADREHLIRVGSFFTSQGFSSDVVAVEPRRSTRISSARSNDNDESEVSRNLRSTPSSTARAEPSIQDSQVTESVLSLSQAPRAPQMPGHWVGQSSTLTPLQDRTQLPLLSPSPSPSPRFVTPQPRAKKSRASEEDTSAAPDLLTENLTTPNSATGSSDQSTQHHKPRNSKESASVSVKQASQDLTATGQYNNTQRDVLDRLLQFPSTNIIIYGGAAVFILAIGLTLGYCASRGHVEEDRGTDAGDYDGTGQHGGNADAHVSFQRSRGHFQNGDMHAHGSGYGYAQLYVWPDVAQSSGAKIPERLGQESAGKRGQNQEQEQESDAEED